MKLPDNFTSAFDALHEAAIAQSGLQDFGATDYHEGMRQILAAFDEDMGTRFTASGREAAAGTVIGLLIGRLLTIEGWKRHPEYKQEKIQRPLIIVGLPRTGSTVLHNLLSMDTQLQGPEMWLLLAPMVRPPRDTWAANPYYQGCVAGMKAFMEAVPELNVMHDYAADKVDECILGLGQGFVDNRLACGFPVPTYEAWWWRQSEVGAYRYYADMLRLIGLGDRRRWLLKNPHHLFHMDALFDVFPDACVIQTHRDPVKVMPSIASLVSTAQRLFVGDNGRPMLVGASETYKWFHAILRSESVRQQHEDQYLDVLHRDFLADPIGSVKRIYERFGLELSDVSEARMRQWLAEQNPELKHGHRYQASTFGLSEDGLREMFADYIQRYDL